MGVVGSDVVGFCSCNFSVGWFCLREGEVIDEMFEGVVDGSVNLSEFIADELENRLEVRCGRITVQLQFVISSQ